MFHRLSSCFTAGGKAGGGKTGKSEEKGGKGRAHTNGKPQDKKKRQERHETDKEKTVLCRVASELSLVPASLCRSIRQEEDFVWEMC